MNVPAKYFLTPRISQLLQSIEASREVIDAIKIPPEIEKNIRRQSSLKSSLFSARVEGNTLTLDDLSSSTSKDQQKVEVFNLLKALNLLNQRSNRDITTKQILELQKMVMSGIIESRVGRLLIQLIMQKNGYGMKGLLSVEEYLDNHRAEYYSALEDTQKDVTDYLEFMLEAIAYTAQKAKELVLEKQQAEVEDYLLPRRAEILHIIKDQGLVNFDMIRRRFMVVPERTLSYDLKKLQDQGLIRKRGSTKGVYYEAV